MATGGKKRKPRRRTSSARRRRKYVSISRCLAAAPPKPANVSPPPLSAAAPDELDLSPLFDAAPSLTDILGCGDETSSAVAAGDYSTPVGSLDDEEELARRVLRGRERWVYCQESSSPCASDEAASAAPPPATFAGAPLLKLDYEQVLTAWSDRGPLYIAGSDGAQLVPASPVMVETPGSPSWIVPDMLDRKTMSGEAAAVRDAGVRRYREKRERRLFAKRVRYEVRKINAEKRPRFKGRFVKAIEEA